MIDSAVEKREMEHKHALIQQRVSPGAAAWCDQRFSPSLWWSGSCSGNCHLMRGLAGLVLHSPEQQQQQQKLLR